VLIWIELQRLLMKKNRVILDTSILGLSYYHDQARTGIFRVAEKLFIELSKNDQVELSIANNEHLPEMLIYLKKNFPDTKFDLLNQKSDKLFSKLENSIISSFNYKSSAQNVVRSLFVRTRGYLKPNFTFDLGTFKDNDIYHSPFLPIPQALKNLTKPKKVITIHDLIPTLFPEYFGPWNKMMMRKILDSIDENTFPVCVSESTKNDLYEATGISAERVSVIHLAASEDIFYNEPNQSVINNTLKKYNIPIDGQYLLSVSTLEPRKNIERTIKAFLNLIQQEHINDLNLVLVGPKGWQFEGIFEEMSIKSSLKDKIITTGFVDDKDLAALYSATLGFVYPSLYEGFGLPTLEAMQCGSPVISSVTSSIPEVVGDAGILIEPTDESAISNAMLQLYSDGDLRKTLKQKATLQAAQFSWQKFTDEHIQLYKKIASK
jgi:glycosyltransferase involved in cell wall biosynthesis